MHLHHAPRCRSPPMHHTPCTMTTVSFATHDLVSHNGNPRPRLIVHSSRLMHHAPRCRSPPMHHAPCTIHHAPCITVLFATHVPCTTVLFVSHDLVGHHKHKHTQHTPTPPPPPTHSCRFARKLPTPADQRVLQQHPGLMTLRPFHHKAPRSITTTPTGLMTPRPFTAKQELAYLRSF